MKYFLIFCVAVAPALAAKWKETRNVIDSAGNEFTCTYKISHHGDTVNKAKSSVSCSPKMDGSPVTENIYISDLGKSVFVSHNIKKGKDSITCINENPQPIDLNGDHAMEIINLITQNATQIPVSICIRDRHDNMVAHVRMKNALMGSVDLACQKARSSALFPFPSAAFKGIPGIELSNGIISNLQGGLPLTTASGMWIGSIGVSGALTGEQDEAFAKIAVDNIDMILGSRTATLTKQTNQTQQTGELCLSQTPALYFDQAWEMVRLVSENATQQMTPVTICIRDRHDNLVAHIRMKDALMGSVDLACQKARSSALFPFASADFKGIPGIELSNGIISNLQGGLPLITASGVWAGSIGVSGAMTGEQDEAFAKIAVDNTAYILENF